MNGPRSPRRGLRPFPLAAGILLWAGATSVVGARDMALFPTDDWVWRVSPVIGPRTLTGDVVVEGENQAVRAPLDDAMKSLSFDFHFRVEGRRGRWGFLGDLGITRLDADRIDGSTTTQASVDLWMGDAALTWGMARWDWDVGSLGVDGRVGFRALSFTGQIERTPGGRVESDRAWVEPLVGARLIGAFPSRWRLEVEADASGFGVGSGSELTSRWAGSIHHRLDPVIEVFAGYRRMDIRSEDQSGENQTEIDARSAGPFLGLTFLMGG